MPKMQVYLPDDLYQELKSQAPDLNVSKVLQEALANRLAELKRQVALRRAIEDYEAEFGAFTEDELAARVAEDRLSAVRAGAHVHSLRTK